MGVSGKDGSLGKSLSLVSVFVASIGPAVAQAPVGWPDTIDVLARERSQAEECVALLKDAGDSATIARGRTLYGEAKAASDGAIAGLEVALAQGYKPEKLTRLQTDLDAAGAGLKDVCDAAIKAASTAAGGKGIVSELAKAAIEPLIGAIKDGVGAVWARQIEEDKAEQDSIKGQLEAAKWPEFGP